MAIEMATKEKRLAHRTVCTVRNLVGTAYVSALLVCVICIYKQSVQQIHTCYANFPDYPNINQMQISSYGIMKPKTVAF